MEGAQGAYPPGGAPDTFIPSGASVCFCLEEVSIPQAPVLPPRWARVIIRQQFHLLDLTLLGIYGEVFKLGALRSLVQRAKYMAKRCGPPLKVGTPGVSMLIRQISARRCDLGPASLGSETTAGSTARVLRRWPILLGIPGGYEASSNCRLGPAEGIASFLLRAVCLDDPQD